MAGIAATPEAASVPLPDVDDTIYHTSPAPTSPYMNSIFDGSTPQTVRPTPSSRRPPLSGVFSSAKPTPFTNNQFGLEEDDTPRPRRSQRIGGGKYHPGRRPMETSRTREATPESVIHHSPQLSSGTGSDCESEMHWESEGARVEEEEEDNSEDDFDDMDQTMALPMETPMGRRQVAGFPTTDRSRRHTGRSSPGRTPAKMLLGHDNNFTANFDMQAQTPRPTDFENTSIPPSMFADIQKTPFLSAASPHKLNAMPGISNNPFLMETPKLAPGEKDTDFMQYQDTPGHSMDAFVDFSPEKRMSGMPEDPQLTVKKRRSPRKHGSIEKTPRNSSRNFKSPVKAFAQMFENISAGRLSVSIEEKKAARRRRETQEFREFSAIDLEQLKGFLPPEAVSGIEEEPTEDADQAVEKALEEPMEVSPSDSPEDINQENTPEPISVEEDEVEVKEEVTHSSEEAIIQTVEDPITSKSSLEVPPTPAPNVRLRVRSGSCPPAPQPIENTLDVRKPEPVIASLMDIDPKFIISLNNRIAQLEDQLETTTVQLDKTERTLQAERRARMAAQETCEFLELERKFGVCCKHAPGAKTREEKLGAAAVRLPGSPAGSIVSSYSQHDDDRRRPASRLGDRPGSRLGDRPASRLAGGARPASRLAGLRNDQYSKVAPPVGGPVTRKRVRDEPAAGIVGRKPQVPRQDKRVLSAGMAAAVNAPDKPAASSGLAKKPEKVGGIARMAANRNASGGAAVKGALARGARR